MIRHQLEASFLYAKRNICLTLACLQNSSKVLSDAMKSRWPSHLSHHHLSFSNLWTFPSLTYFRPTSPSSTSLELAMMSLSLSFSLSCPLLGSFGFCWSTEIKCLYCCKHHFSSRIHIWDHLFRNHWRSFLKIMHADIFAGFIGYIKLYHPTIVGQSAQRSKMLFQRS